MINTIERYILSIISILLMYTPAISQETVNKEKPDAAEMSLSDCVLLAVRKNRTIESAHLDRVVQKFNLEVEEDKFTPKITLNSSAVKTSSTVEGTNQTDTDTTGSVSVAELAPTGAQLNLTATGGIDRIRGDDKSRSASLSLTLAQPLLKGGGIDVNTASVRIARINERINILALKSTLIDTATSVISAYRSFLQAKYQLDISKKSLERAKELVEVNRELIAAGRIAEVEIVQTEADAANRELDVLQSENNLDSARLSLIKLLDIDKSTKIVPTEKITIEPASLDYEMIKEKALDNRPDYLSALMNLEISRINLMVAKNNRLWDLSLTGGYNRSDISGGQSDSTGDSRSWNIGISLVIPLRLGIPLSDLTLQQGYISSKINLEKAEIGLKEIRENVEIEIQDAIRDADIKMRQVKLAQQSRNLAEKKLEIENEKMKAGRSSNFQLVTYQNDLVNAQNNEINAIIAYLNALTNLDRTIGVTLDRWDIKVVDRYNEDYVR